MRNSPLLQYKVVLAVVLCAAHLTLAAAPPAPVTADDVLKYLDYTIDWYRRVASLDPTPVNSQDVMFRETIRDQAIQVLQDGFTFARAEAQLLENGNGSTTKLSGGERGRTAAQAAATAAQRIAQLQAELDRINQQIQRAAPADLPLLNAQKDKLAAEINLASARRDAINTFMSGLGTGGTAGLLEQINDLQKTVSDASPDRSSPKAEGSTAATVAAAAQQAVHPESAGVLGLISEMFTLAGRMSELRDLSEKATLLIQRNAALRAPIRAELQDAIRRGDALATTRETDTAQMLSSQAQQIDALTARFKQVAAVAVPLGQQSAYLESTRNTLTEWRAALGHAYARIIRALLIRLAAIAAALVVLLGISWLWRRATFRYVTDLRRRRQFLLLRRIVVGVIMLIVVVAGVVTEFSSIATFAGLITAGIAVALQTVILSGFAYFFFIGRYGVRVGDRVTISGITGDVIEIGLFRLYLMELGGAGRDLYPTGRIVVFSNAVLFQPSAFFKQLPGTEYAWHEVALTLAPDSDRRLAEKRLLGAVESVYATYKEKIDEQYAAVKDSMHLQMPQPHPEGRLRLVDAGLEFVVRYPVEIHRAAEIDDQVTRKLLDTIEGEPKLKLVASGTPNIQAATPVVSAK